MKNIVTLFLFPLLVAIIGNNSHFQYCVADTTTIEKRVTDSAVEQAKTFILKREVEFVPSYFACKEQKFIVRLLGAIIIFIPFYFPFKGYYKEKALNTGFILNNLGNDFLERHIRNKVVSKLKDEIKRVFIFYIFIVNALIFFLGLFCKLPIFMYSTLLYERVVNLIAWLV